MSTFSQTAEVDVDPSSPPGWKQEINARLSAHRSRRSGNNDRQPTLPGMELPTPAPRASVAARVAERYSKVPTYSEALAAEAAKAARAAEAATQAALEAHQAAQRANDALRDAESRSEIETLVSVAPEAPPAPKYRIDPASLPVFRPSMPSPGNSRSHSVDPHPHIVDPLEDALVAPAQPLPARVLEFPRELVAARKARPRLAEGPLLDALGGSVDPEQAQLRIFEVEPDTISREPEPMSVAKEPSVLPGWNSIRLDATPSIPEADMAAWNTDKPMQGARIKSESSSQPFSSRAKAGSPRRRSELSGMLPLDAPSDYGFRGHMGSHSSHHDGIIHGAPMRDRLMAALLDAVLVLFAFVLFVAVFAACTAHPPTGKPAMIAAGIALFAFVVLYQWLFFTFAESTPGMRFAKIALCTFDDENPGRKALQHRIGALFLAALPLGLGFLWALLDDDRLSWHDRMTRTYQRSYR